jgi:hypothetical protein
MEYKYILNEENLQTLEVTSNIFNNNWIIPAICSCDWQNFFPTLEIKSIPIETQTLILIIENIDTKSEISLHLIAWNIPVNWEEIIINEDILRESKKWINDFWVKRYMWPCLQESNSNHRYHFKIYWLNRKIDLSENSKKEDIYKIIENQKNLTSYWKLTWIYKN